MQIWAEYFCHLIHHKINTITKLIHVCNTSMLRWQITTVCNHLAWVCNTCFHVWALSPEGQSDLMVCARTARASWTSVYTEQIIEKGIQFLLLFFLEQIIEKWIQLLFLFFLWRLLEASVEEWRINRRASCGWLKLTVCCAGSERHRARPPLSWAWISVVNKKLK